jgi:hypothetical protein
MTTAILRDERDLLWLIVDTSEAPASPSDVRYDVHFCAREEPGEPPEPFLSAAGYSEPRAGLASLVENIGHAVSGNASALRHDPIADGLSIELKARDGGPDPSFEVVVWLDLTRMSRALRARGTRGRHQSGLRMIVRRSGLEAFRAALFLLASESEPGIR